MRKNLLIREDVMFYVCGLYFGMYMCDVVFLCGVYVVYAQICVLVYKQWGYRYGRPGGFSPGC